VKAYTLSNKKQMGLMIGALGVVFGDIGTSPLYALRECFNGTHAMTPTRANLFGVLSLIIWSLLLIVSVKYLLLVLRADNKGEGGILSLLSLAVPEKPQGRRRAALLGIGIFGSALLYGDGMITPAITVLSAVEGINVVTPMFEHWVVPITVGILAAVFSFQRLGTERVGSMFGSVMMIWFLGIAWLGINGILRAPEILAAINPVPGIRFLITNGWSGFIVLGAVFLAVTGAEALYADMGHFGIRPIRVTWFAVVFPALVLNYLGQGALLLKNPAAAENPFFLLAPLWALRPLVVLATMAAVIASQALISGVYSLTMQAVQLGFLPRLQIKHTSSDIRGQIYMPRVNWTLMLACIALVLGFRSSSNLAAAYGIAVTLTMAITTVLFYFAAQRLWKWSVYKAAAICLTLLLLELAFLAANLVKIAHGGWFPLLVGMALFTIMSTWKRGRYLLRSKLEAGSLDWSLFMEDLRRHPPSRVKGTAVFMAGNPAGTPLALLHNLKHNKILHERIILLTILTSDVPHVNPKDRVRVTPLTEGFYQVRGHYGFMDEPDVPDLLEACRPHGLQFRPPDTTFFLSRETILPASKPSMALWRSRLFAFMARNAQSATAYFKLPANRVVELGMQVEF
jgi:KUP system potassium uptake protein